MSCDHDWRGIDYGRMCFECGLVEDGCYMCGRAPCQCDEMYDAWRDRQLEEELETE